MKGNLIGLCISECVLAIAHGDVKYAEVKKIVGEIPLPTDFEKGKFVQIQREGPWRLRPNSCEQIFLQLSAEEKIEQPRRIRNRPARPSLCGGIWVTSMRDIIWEKK